ncbi:DUF4145 domain-containing protein [Aquitalea sp. S1-19]|nr:DUF4145 domain-containing protein [Aquitalea sp. S1-19]MCP9760876.1 DUF4145 domain-containing protein [Aquitalea sp. S1-19]MCP9760981.1 DUF4145 domain-containing protein [Aquitalea sp. S1-19]
MSKSPIITPCSSCNRDTRQDVINENIDSFHDYRMDTHYQIIACRGCETKSFRIITYYIEDAYQISDNEWDVPKDFETYPKTLPNHQSIQDIDRVPDVVRNIYQESIEAIKVKSNILGGIGLRATIEAICNEQKIIGRTLETRIDKLKKAGLVSIMDADRLHAIRFLGNDAAHEIQSPDIYKLLAALKVIEHLITNLYILDSDVNSTLQTIIKEYSEFEKLLEIKLKNSPTNVERPLINILGRDTRRLHGHLKSHEDQLILKIKSGTYSLLTIGKIDSFAGSKDKLQHYIAQSPSN